MQKNASQSSCVSCVCVCVLVLGHSHSALKSRQLTAHTTGNARAPARAASQDCSAWEPTAARSHFAVYILRPKRKPTSSTFVFSFVVVVFIVCCCFRCCYCWHWAWEFVASLALSFGARVARIESERSVDCSLRFELHLESFTTALADHQWLYVALVRVLHSLTSWP